MMNPVRNSNLTGKDDSQQEKAISNGIKRFLLALQFLTIFPVKIKGKISDKDFGRSLIYFPFVGFLIGFLCVLVLFIFGFLPQAVAAALVLLASVIITGAIHLDGLADTCDGFYAGRTKQEILDIMRDSRTGAMGTVGIALVLLLKFALMANISYGYLWKALLMAPVFSRWAQALACYLFDYARGEGKAQAFIEYARLGDILFGMLFTIAGFALLMQFKGIIIFAISLFFILPFMFALKTKINGITGDIIGGINEIAEVFILFVIVCFS